MQASLGCAELTCMLQTPCREALDLPWHLRPSSLVIPPPLDQILAEHEIKLANCSPFLCLSGFFWSLLCTFLMHIPWVLQGLRKEN